MTDRHAAYLVTLDRDVREDDAQPTINAIRQIRGVVSVEPVLADASLHTARERVKWELLDKLYRFCREVAGHSEAEVDDAG